MELSTDAISLFPSRVIVRGDEGGDALPQLLHAGEAGAAQGVPGQEAEPDRRLIEPGGVGRG
ncbi:MAG TPA: hypothetical protein VGW37_13205 [Terriglobia bacterium]|nr:hypothetical protein [Terriglobia bacterium]